MIITQDDIRIDETGDKKISDVIENGLINFNASYIGDYKPKPFTLYIKIIIQLLLVLLVHQMNNY